ncbi:site-specific DNA-methyltransferase [Clostridium chrysemydis]|uniref:site-specific DNA-methyltransferase n=1 Tax=Clostridium chrysemydis TaxID=2665504 RepID=UPI001883D208|nr:DNA methyltransferase [Clostridium chrysemydis]
MSNLSKVKRERMLNFLNKIREEHDDTEVMIAINEIENELTSKKYGLVWEEHEERVDVEMKTKVPVFSEVTDKEIVSDSNKRYNFLLEGDNLHSLKLLEKTHSGTVDVIYIDPPYNRGNNDFIYDDKFIDADDGYKHSKWLSFMEQRLRIARELLSDSGIIFISINDVEQAQLKILCDEIFDNNCMGQIIRGTGTPTGQGTNGLVTEYDYVLVYGKSKESKILGVSYDEKDTKIYDKKDEGGTYLTRTLRKTGKEDRREDRPTMWYPLEAPDGTLVYPYGPTGYESRWRCGKDTYEEFVKENRIEWKQDKGEWKVYLKFYVDGKLKRPTTLWLDNVGNKKATSEIKSLFGKDVFSHPKPVQLIVDCLKISSHKSAVVLDFFAGSGTTGQAVLEMNRQDNGNRTFILCTNNQNEICEKITYERMKKVIDGYEFKGKKEIILFEKAITLKDLSKMDKILGDVAELEEQVKDSYDKVVKEFKNGVLKVIGRDTIKDKVKGIPANLMYYKTDYVLKHSSDEEHNFREELLKHIAEMVQLEHGIKIDNSKYVILLSDEDADSLEGNEEVLNRCRVIYISSQVLLTKQQEVLFNKLKIDIIPIPEYYFDGELREVGEI